MTIRVRVNQSAVLRAIARRNMSQNMLSKIIGLCDFGWVFHA